MTAIHSSNIFSANARFATAYIVFHILLCALSYGTEFSNYGRDVSWVSANSPENRKLDFSKVPGTVIAHSPKTSGIFLGSPSICILPDGTYLASHDLFGKNWKEKSGSSTLIYESKDKGITWRQIGRVDGQEWAPLFYHNNALYLIGAGIPHCGFVVKKSVDGGKTWTVAKDEKSGIICRRKMQASTNPIAIANGRIYVSAEISGYTKPKGWCHMYSVVMSAPADSDLLDAKNWTMSSKVVIPEDMATLAHVGWLEGNMVMRRSDGKVFNILRTHGITDEIAAMYEISADGKTAMLDSKNMFIRMPGACKKFYIIYDEKTSTYYAASNWTLERDRGKVSNCPHPIKAERTRNTLALSRSKNLTDWEVYTVLLHDDDIDHAGFQYPSMTIDGDDLVMVLRTAYPDENGKADSQHNSNFITFHRIKNFRERTFGSKALSGAITPKVYPY